MVYGFVQQSGGHVRVRTEEGQGTTVAIYLPRHLGTVSSPVEAQDATAPTKTAASSVVLLVEDEKATVLAVKRRFAVL